MNPEMLMRLQQMLPALLRTGQKAMQLKYLIPAGFFAHMGVREYGKAGERKLTKAQIDLQEKVAKASAEATKRLVEESRKGKREEKRELLSFVREQGKRETENQMMQSFVDSQNRQMAMLMQAFQAVAARPTGAPTGGAGMLDLVRTRF